LPLHCLRQVGSEQWALHVPLGKLHTERLVPVDAEVRRIVERILALRTSSWRLAGSDDFLLPHRDARHSVIVRTLQELLAQAARRAGCVSHVLPHRLRHSFATEMLRLGVSLPALMKLLGHKNIRMTLRYTDVTQEDLQREFQRARQNAAHPHHVPILTLPKDTPGAGLSGVCQALATTRHLLQTYRLHLSDEKIRRRLQRLDKRLLKVASQLQTFKTK
jgi:hypothetical protein